MRKLWKEKDDKKGKNNRDRRIIYGDKNRNIGFRK